MAKIKSLEDLMKIKDDAVKNLKLRESGKRGNKSHTLIAHLFAYSFEVKSTILALP